MGNPSSRERLPSVFDSVHSRAAVNALLIAMLMDGKRQPSVRRKAINSPCASTMATAAPLLSLSSSALTTSRIFSASVWLKTVVWYIDFCFLMRSEFCIGYNIPHYFMGSEHVD